MPALTNTLSFNYRHLIETLVRLILISNQILARMKLSKKISLSNLVLYSVRAVS